MSDDVTQGAAAPRTLKTVAAELEQAMHELESLVEQARGWETAKTAKVLFVNGLKAEYDAVRAEFEASFEKIKELF